jgi:hypothetical protein
LLQDNNTSPAKIRGKKDEERIKERIDALELRVFGSIQEPTEDELDTDIQKIKVRPSDSEFAGSAPNLG